MPKAYWISSYKVVHDPDKMKAYAALAGPAIQAHGGRFLARGGRVETLEGFKQFRIVAVEFPNLETALRCYRSEAYQKARAAMGDGAERDTCVVEAVE